YAKLPLAAGDHLFMLDVTSWDHGGSYHYGIDADVPFTLHSPLGEQPGTPFASYGPFDHVQLIDHQGKRTLLRNQADYEARKGGMTAAELDAYRAWDRPLDTGMYSDADVFGLNVWRTEVERLAVPPALSRAVLPVPEAAVLPRLANGDCELV